MNTIKVIIATVGHKSYYYNSSQNTFQDSDNYSVSDNPAFYDISSEAACEDALKEFGNLTVSLEVVEFNLDTNEFVG